MRKRRIHTNGIITGLVAGMLLLSGCGKEAEETVQEPPEKVQESASETQEPEQTKGIYVPVVTLESGAIERYVPEEDQILLTASWELPTIVTTGDDAGQSKLEKALNVWVEEQKQSFMDTVEQYEQDAQDYLESMKDNSEPTDFAFYGFSTDLGTEYMRVDSSVLSFRQMYSDYTGGAHGNYGYEGVTFDVETGNKLELTDLLVDEVTFEQFCDNISELCAQRAKEEYSDGLYENYEEIMEESITEQANWYLDAAGLTMIFNPYEIGPYAMGPAFVTIPYADLTGALKEEYLGLSEAGSAVLEPGKSVYLTFADGMEREVLLSFEVLDEEMWSTRITLKVEEQEEVTEGYASVRGARLIRQESGRVYLVYYVDMASDDYVTYVYDITDGKLMQIAEIENSSSLDDGYMNTEVLRVQARLDVLGTYRAPVDYQINEDGTLQQLTEIYELENNSPSALITTIRELPVMIDGEETTLPTGSRLRILRTDLKGTVWFREEETGIEGEIHYTCGSDEDTSWPIYIDGVEEYEYFEMLPYAG